MSKIAIFDPYLRKFTDGMEKWWLSKGHEVRMDRYYDPELAEWADILWFDTVDNNIKSATNPSQAILDDKNNYFPWDLHHMDLTNKRIIVRPIDIEVWYGHQNGVTWDVVTDVIFIAPHIRRMMEDQLPEHINVYTVPCAVDLDRYAFRERVAGDRVAIVSEKWTSKGTDLILQIALELQHHGEYTFHWLGKWSDYEWEKAYFEDFIKHHNLKFEFTEWIESPNAVDEFLEDKNYLLHASHKEAFSYATAEAMAKGIKPVLHRFYGADDLWSDMTWSSVMEAVDDITELKYDSLEYRQYLINHGYTLPQMMEGIDNIIFNEGG